MVAHSAAIGRHRAPLAQRPASLNFRTTPVKRRTG
jgi:hypothetical protein